MKTSDMKKDDIIEFLTKYPKYVLRARVSNQTGGSSYCVCRPNNERVTAKYVNQSSARAAMKALEVVTEDPMFTDYKVKK